MPLLENNKAKTPGRLTSKDNFATSWALGSLGYMMATDFNNEASGSVTAIPLAESSKAPGSFSVMVKEVSLT